MGIILLLLVFIAGILVVPRLAGYQSLAVLSGSMEPEIPVGATVFIKDVEPRSLKSGDVITYKLNEETRVTHRVVQINEESQTVITKGDANGNTDGSPVSYSQIEGKVAFQIPLLGYISIYLKTPTGIAVICGLMVVIIILCFLPDILSKESEKKG